MASRLAVCRNCGRYALRARCLDCEATTVSPHPARFSPDDRFAVYRRRLRKLDEQAAAQVQAAGKGDGT